MTTPICASSDAHRAHVVEFGTLSSMSGSGVSSAAHRIGSAAFFAPETRTSPVERNAALDRELVHDLRFQPGAAPIMRRCAHSAGVSVCIDSA